MNYKEKKKLFMIYLIQYNSFKNCTAEIIIKKEKIELKILIMVNICYFVNFFVSPNVLSILLRKIVYKHTIVKSIHIK